MMIRKLPQYLINQIAAGEIIERPSSIVKELMENSIDARPTEIRVNLLHGGLNGIEIEDDGCGIMEDDLLQSIESHATSKITSINDLENCRTHGFRGEALAAISSVSNLQIFSREKNDKVGHELVRKNENWEIKPSPILQGTKVRVTEIFNKIPARRKFLKTFTTELSHCKQEFLKIGLIHQNIKFTLCHENKCLQVILGTSLDERFSKILGISNDQVKTVGSNFGEIDVNLIISTSANTRSTKSQEFFYVNKRIIKSPVLQHATKLAFNSLVHEFSRPNFLVDITLPGSMVDINVHPSKNEIRFKDNSYIHSIITNLFKEALSNDNALQRKNFAVIKEDTDIDHSGFFKNNQDHTRLDEEITQLELKQAFNSKNDRLVHKNREESSLGYAIGQLLGIYILAQNKDGLIVVDAHAAHERILFEGFLLQLNQETIKPQLLIEPVVFQTDADKLKLIFTLRDELHSLGFNLETFSSNSFVIREVPSFLGEKNWTVFIQEILSEFEVIVSLASLKERLNNILSTMACRSAIKANQKLSIPEMNQLLRAMEKIKNGGICNHGRPTWVQLNVSTLNKLFSRGH
ncbi:MAG: hypothetical protein CBC42_03645 [Betaproteobacteria bacterium TMED82]|nr:MAG: hypothetical protein CBC42_03645 [Betaproteobacteria bacterium TMED82]|tara:strand:+ start:30737 stop:32470 length:1734 start_codon:yes stop_codon:yes gene_type:complete